MRAAGPALQESAADGGASFLTVSRLDGCFGLGGLSGSASPISGALAGLAKTAAREWPAVNCKAIDLDAAFDVARRRSQGDRRRAAQTRPRRDRRLPAGPNQIELESLHSGSSRAQATGNRPGRRRRGGDQRWRPRHHRRGGRRPGLGISAAPGSARAIARARARGRLACRNRR